MAKWAFAREQCGGTVYLKLEDTIYIYIHVAIHELKIIYDFLL